MRIYSTQSFCFDNPNDITDKFHVNAMTFTEVPEWVAQTTLWILATRNLPGNPAKIIVVNAPEIQRVIELEGGNTDGLTGETAVDPEEAALLESGMVEVSENGQVTNSVAESGTPSVLKERKKPVPTKK